MRVRVVDYTIEASDDYRRAINAHYGKPGLASRDEVKRWLMSYGSSEDQNLMHDLEVGERIEAGTYYDVDPDDGITSVLLTGKQDDDA